MPRKAKQQTDNRINGKANGTFKGFINHNMVAAEKDRYEAWAEALTVADFFAMVEKVVDTGYVLTVKIDEYNACYQSTLTCRNIASENNGFVLPGRAPTATDALKVVLFKHTELLNEDWMQFHEREKEERQWG